MTAFFALPLWLLATIILGLSIVVGLGGVKLVRDRGWMMEADDTGAAGLVHAFIGVLYAVALGLMVVAVQGDYAEVDSVAMREANIAGDLYIDLEGLPDPARSELQGLVKRYVSAVADDEWPAVARGATSDATWALVDSIARGIITYEPPTPHAELVYPEILTEVNQLMDHRRERLFLGTGGVGAVTWTVVLIGAFITLSVAWFFHTPSARAHYWLSAAMSAIFGLMIFLIVAMDHPLLGDFSVQPDAFRGVKENMDRWDRDRDGAMRWSNLQGR